MCRKTAWFAGLLLFVFFAGCDVDTPKRMPLNPPGIDPLMDMEHPGGRPSRRRPAHATAGSDRPRRPCSAGDGPGAGRAAASPAEP